MTESDKLVIDLDKLNDALAYQAQINQTRFEQMVFIKDDQPVELTIKPEALAALTEFGMSNVSIISKFIAPHTEKSQIGD